MMYLRQTPTFISFTIKLVSAQRVVEVYQQLVVSCAVIESCVEFSVCFTKETTYNQMLIVSVW